MYKLSVEQKQLLVNMLEKHYSINETEFIESIAENTEDGLTLTLIAYALSSKNKRKPSNVTKHYVEFSSTPAKINIIKAVKDTLKIGLVEAKEKVDNLQFAFESSEEDAKKLFEIMEHNGAHIYKCF